MDDALIWFLIILWVTAHLVPVGKVLHSAVTLRLMVSDKEQFRWLEGAILFSSVGYAVYGWGLMVGFDTRPYRPCMSANPAPGGQPARIEDSLLPVSHRCVWADGTTIDLVPLWMNLTVFTCIAGTAVCFALAIYAVLRFRRRVPA
ncbi:hypothetical protein [Phytoactinopolyspora endophytica]|uniref:hypothetical protein n=1 Tax=Phytoactinopolyspora endophytica TaxID=1642495 RepID=UPI00101BA007|nr:hypothetical protein [Phytoactinopolyspora endophytica]